MKQRIRIHKAEPNTGVLNYSHLLDAPAGKHGFVEAKKGHLYFGSEHHPSPCGGRPCGRGAGKLEQLQGSTSSGLCIRHQQEIQPGWVGPVRLLCGEAEREGHLSPYRLDCSEKV